jgi:hypothetical protein
MPQKISTSPYRDLLRFLRLQGRRMAHYGDGMLLPSSGIRNLLGSLCSVGRAIGDVCFVSNNIFLGPMDQ